MEKIVVHEKRFKRILHMKEMKKALHEKEKKTLYMETINDIFFQTTYDQQKKNNFMIIHVLKF